MPRQTSRDLRNESRFEVLHALFELGPSTRQEIARHTGLSTATVATLVTQFLAEGVLRIATLERKTVGRPYERLAIDPDRGRIVGVDVAETYVAATVFDIALTPISHGEVMLDEHQNSQSYVVDGIVRAVEAAVTDSEGGLDRILGGGVSMPGQVSPDAGVSVFAPNWDWHDVRIEALLEQRLRIPVYVDNPLKAVTLSEMWFGVGRVSDSMAVVNLGTGVGAGIAIDGALIRGANNNAGEWGHTLLQLDGRQCRCGRRGCVEAYLGVHGLETSLAEIDPAHPALRQPLQRGFIEAVATGLAMRRSGPDRTRSPYVALPGSRARRPRQPARRPVHHPHRLDHDRAGRLDHPGRPRGATAARPAGFTAEPHRRVVPRPRQSGRPRDGGLRTGTVPRPARSGQPGEHPDHPPPVPLPPLGDLSCPSPRGS